MIIYSKQKNRKEVMNFEGNHIRGRSGTDLTLPAAESPGEDQGGEMAFWASHIAEEERRADHI